MNAQASAIIRSSSGLRGTQPSSERIRSLLATSIVFQIRQRWNCAIGVDEVFTNATFGAMAALLEARTAANEEREEVLL